MLERAQRSQGGAAVLILDLDHFKLVNDRHGHLAGDRVLSSVAAALRAEVRDNDLVGRFGGEEFVIMLPGHEGAAYDRAELEAVADRIRRRIDELGVEIATPDGPLTVEDLSVSVGGATFPHDAADLDGLLEVADSALYAAKRAGRNAVRMGLHLHSAQQPVAAMGGGRRPARPAPPVARRGNAPLSAAVARDHVRTAQAGWRSWRGRFPAGCSRIFLVARQATVESELLRPAVDHDAGGAGS